MLTQPSDSGLSIRTVEWMRDNGARGLVNQVENMYYSLNAPTTGGPALRALPSEGVWRPTFSRGGSRPPVVVTQFRPDALYPQNVAGVAWIDHTRTSVWHYPGQLEPSVAMASRGPMQIPPQLRDRLVATFNSGFKLQDSGGGFASGGHTYAPLKNGPGDNPALPQRPNRRTSMGQRPDRRLQHRPLRAALPDSR
jgi:hypothetical protein